jgi:hypothetical protein
MFSAIWRRDDSKLSKLAKGFALDIPWSWRLREGGE